MNWIKALAMTWGPRLLGSALAGLATYIGTKTGGAIQVDPEKAAITVTSVLFAYSGGHKALSSFINPGDAAKGRVADAEKTATQGGGTVNVKPD